VHLNDPELEIVIVSHGAEQLLRRCLQSLLLHPSRRRTHVTVVDSGSEDGTPDMVQSEFPEVRLIRRTNIGFSAANNVVLDEATAPFVLLLNPDTEVHHGTLDSSMDRMESEPSIGMVGCRLVTESGELDHACKRSFPTPVGALAHFTGIGLTAAASNRLSQYRATDLGEHEAGEVDAVNGAYMLVRLEALQEVGRLDEGYWLYMEDLDWCRRFWRAGWAVFYEPSGTALHVKGGSSGKRRGVKQEIAFHRGMGRFYRRFDAPSTPTPVNLMVYTGIAVKLLVSLSINRFQAAVRACRS
jgi:N-acetylglucosaminyl-diphospho-decaprenol L-rhamnosyltransferase